MVVMFGNNNFPENCDLNNNVNQGCVPQEEVPVVHGRDLFERTRLPSHLIPKETGPPVIERPNMGRLRLIEKMKEDAALQLRKKEENRRLNASKFRPQEHDNKAKKDGPLGNFHFANPIGNLFGQRPGETGVKTTTLDPSAPGKGELYTLLIYFNT